MGEFSVGAALGCIKLFVLVKGKHRTPVAVPHHEPREPRLQAVQDGLSGTTGKGKVREEDLQQHMEWHPWSQRNCELLTLSRGPLIGPLMRAEGRQGSPLPNNTPFAFPGVLTWSSAGKRASQLAVSPWAKPRALKLVCHRTAAKGRAGRLHGWSRQGPRCSRGTQQGKGNQTV